MNPSKKPTAADQKKNLAAFLPMSRAEMELRGWDELDVLLVTGDAYVDHPSFGMAVIGRALEAAGFRVGIVAQPDWTKPDDFTVMGAPRLFVGVTAGAMDSMVANYTANRKPRHDDAYSPGGESGRRPNYATIVYTNVVRHAFPGVPVVLGGIEASLRRFAHYDYWKDRVRRSILLDSKADLIVSGMGEVTIVEIARRLKAGKPLDRIPGTVVSIPESDLTDEETHRALLLDDYEVVSESALHFLKMSVALEKALVCGRTGAQPGQKADLNLVVQRHGDRLVVEWLAPSMTPRQLDAAYAWPYQRRAHPSYKQKVPALNPVQFSVTSHRGCFGGCSFCALSVHQGRHVVSRSPESILEEIRRLTQHPDFHGTISDVGGPSANMYGMTGYDKSVCATCRRPSCLHPAVCPNLNTAHGPHLSLLRRALEIEGVEHLFVASGIRYDLLQEVPELEAVPDRVVERYKENMAEKKARLHLKHQREEKKRQENEAYMQLLVRHLVGGHLSVAPEHVTRSVLALMRKPSIQVYEAFAERFEEMSREIHKKQYLTPYFIASFPGSTEEDMRSLMRFLKLSGRKLQQIQDFLPCPMTLAAAMYHSEMDYRDLRHLYVAKSHMEREHQRALLLYHQQDELPESRTRKAAPKPPRGRAAVPPIPYKKGLPKKLVPGRPRKKRS
ncbi:MAG TPA: YgiQ family radical SAM protein [Candidatus Sumerlaeota bacterium]|nr:YgiQ family radical SAM protein [Candidatus Sumerlaeota bacterium]